jgi:hypothetical protein
MAPYAVAVLSRFLELGQTDRQLTGSLDEHGWAKTRVEASNHFVGEPDMFMTELKFESLDDCRLLNERLS